MDNKTVLSDNELIAEFMGAERREGPRVFNPDQKIVQWIIKGNPYNQHRDDIKHWYQPVELKYHESWDWLMPVVEKIQFFAHLKIENGQCFISVNGVLISGVVNGSNIENTYKAVVEYIKYYNSTKTL